MKYERTPHSLNIAFDLDAVKLHMRVDADDELVGINAMAAAAALEVEIYCDLALLSQTITATADAWCDAIALPVGPFNVAALADHPVTVQLRDDEGNLTAHPAGWWIEPGRYPVLHLTTKGTGAQIVVTYPAGYGAEAASLPADLALAVQDMALIMYDRRGDADMKPGLSPAAARICARHRRLRA